MHPEDNGANEGGGGAATDALNTRKLDEQTEPMLDKNVEQTAVTQQPKDDQPDPLQVRQAHLEADIGEVLKKHRDVLDEYDQALRSQAAAILGVTAALNALLGVPTVPAEGEDPMPLDIAAKQLRDRVAVLEETARQPAEPGAAPVSADLTGVLEQLDALRTTVNTLQLKLRHTI
jgi:hypothetical protein